MLEEVLILGEIRFFSNILNLRYHIDTKYKKFTVDSNGVCFTFFCLLFVDTRYTLNPRSVIVLENIRVFFGNIFSIP